MKTAIITLLTDFGEADGYVAQMRGVMLGIQPAARLVDLSHAVPAQSVRRAAVLLDSVVEAFPAGTIHVCVVDPGVGSARRIVGVELAGQRFVAPDNGVLSAVAARFPPARVHVIAEPRFWRHPVSNTFHGRDIMAPVAAHWSFGRDLAEFGPPLEGSLVPLAVRLPQVRERETVGEIEWIDSFGNLITNIPASLLPGSDRSRLVVTAGPHRFTGVNRYYSEQPAGAPLALVGSSGRLEVAVNGGNAAAQLELGEGTEVRVRE